MKKIFKNLILFLFLSSNAAFCYTLTNAELTSYINSEITKETAAKLKDYSSDFKINISGITQGNITTADNHKPKIEIISQNQNFSPVSYRRIIIKDLKNNTIKAFAVNVQTLVYKDVLVASDTISFNEEINSTNTTIQRKEISKYLGKTFSSEIKGYSSKRNFQKGSIILSDYIKTKASVLKDSSIDIVFLSKGITIKLKGKALKEGAIGENIPVRSDKYNKIYNAAITSENEVTVRI